MRHRAALSLIPPVIVSFLLFDGTPLHSQAPAATRTTVIISDLHLGPGKDARTGQWSPIEDFRWHEDLTSFLRAIDDAGKGAIDLVLNGDTFELWQSPTPDCDHEQMHLGCTEAEALVRLERVLAAHAPELSSLGGFARSGANRVILVPGDHDGALLFPALAKRVVDAANAPGRVEVSGRGQWLSDDGSVYVEHGHQMAGDPYRFASWPQPFVGDSGRLHLERTWGERLAQGLYNEHEPRFPILDNFAQDGAGLKYLVAVDAGAGPASPIGPLLRFFIARPSWQQFRFELDGGDVQPPAWDLPAVRRTGAAFLIESLLPDDRFRDVANRSLEERRLALDLNGFTDEDIVAICDYRAALRRSRRRLERSMTQAPTVGPAPSECPRTPETRGSAFEYFWRSRDALLSRHLERVQETYGRPGRSIKIFARGHSHLADAGFVPVRGATWPVVLNSGAWHRTVTPFQIEDLMKTRGWSEMDVLRELRPEQLPGCYGVIWIDPYTTEPIPRLRFWRADGRWGTLPRDAAGIATACGGGAGPQA